MRRWVNQVKKSWRMASSECNKIENVLFKFFCAQFDALQLVSCAVSLDMWHTARR
jgi:hypothetical protein